MNDTDLRLLTIDEVRKIIRMGNESIRKHIRNGNLPAKKVGTRYLILESDLKRFITNGARQGGYYDKR